MSSSSTSPQGGVFVSFRGKDVRKTFISYLFNRLDQERFSYFYDEDADDAGIEINKKISSAIHHVSVALIVLSENYADSKYCLNELVEILERRRKHKNLVVIPVFYDVDPADVKNLTSKSKFGEAFRRLCAKWKNDPQIKIWEDNLQEVKGLSGFELKNFRKEPDLLNGIVQSLRANICPSRSLNFPKYVIGADRLVDDVIPLLKIGQDDVRVIGISGTEGIGKTVVAKAVCTGTLGKFERFIFLDKVGEVDSSNFVSLQMKLLQNLTKMNQQTPHDSFHGNIQMIKENLSSKKILLVLDGVTKKEQMENLGVENQGSFHPGSRILITTRDRNLLNDPKVDGRYNVEGLNRDEAFRLFCCHAFKREEPKEGYEELSRYLSHYAGGHPSALEKWGSFLNKTSIVEWRKFSDKLEKWPNHITSIGTNSGPIFTEYPFKVVGPCGSDRSTKSWSDKGNPGVREIKVGFDSEGIKFITVQYDKKGRSQKPVTHGTKGCKTFTRTIELKDPREYLTSVSGHIKDVSGRTILQSLTFHGNRGKLAQIGPKNDGRKFSFPYTGGKIVGFHGSYNNSHLESIGAYYELIAHTPVGYSSGFGPFGGAGEKSWHSGDINGIFAGYADFISSITFKVDKDTSSIPKTNYGRNGGKNTFEVKLETPHEFITSFSGYFENAYDGRILINSLTFRTNKRILGPIGREKGNHFSSSSPSEAMKVTKFFGRTVDDCLESIGAQVESDYPFKSVGLFGCSNASNWDDRNDEYANVRKIIVEFAPSEKFIQSITFYYKLKNGKSSSGKRHPGSSAGGRKPPPIIIDADEYLTSISGYYTKDGITSLTFGSNKRSLGFIACEEGIHFSSPATGGKIVGFCGRSDENLKAIGAHFEKIPHLYPIKSIRPFGGSSGETRDGSSEETWNHRGVKKIEVKHNINIHYIKFVYDDGSDQGYPVTYEGCAIEDNPNVTVVVLDSPREYLTSISGYVQDDTIQSLTFYSNKERYGPYGEEKGKYFWYPSNGSRITRFYGDNGTLKSIGVYVEPIQRMYPFKTVGPFGGSIGTEWDDGVHTDVRGFRISFGKAIKAIGIAYDNNGSFVSGSEHGMGYRNNGSFMLGLKPGKERRDEYEEVLLDYPKERLLSIRIWEDKGQDTSKSIIHDLKIYTTKKTYGPFISDLWQKRDKVTLLHIPLEKGDGRIVGFFGRTDRYLSSIGARLEPYSH